MGYEKGTGNRNGAAMLCIRHPINQLKDNTIKNIEIQLIDSNIINVDIQLTGKSNV